MTTDLSRLLGELIGAPPCSPEAWERSLRPGAWIGRFQLVRELGRGGFGVVFEAQDAELGRRVAFKAIRPGLRARDPADELLRREAVAVGSLQHPNIVTLHDLGACEAGRYLILELLRGQTLAARLARGRLASRDAVRIALAVAAALEHAHAAGVLHRDLKPANVFLTADGGVKVLDFGLARAFGVDGPRGAGTPGYLAPEQRRGGAEDERTDLFALGVLLAEMVTPPAARSARSADGVGAVDLARLPVFFRPVVASLASAEPDGRPRSAAEASAALRRLAQHLDPAPRDRSPSASAAEAEALRQLVLAEQCAARPLFGQDCAEGFRRAAALDPRLAQAHYQLAVWSRRFGGTVADQRASIDAAMRHLDRAPPAERLLVPAMAAQLEGRVGAATRLLREAAEAFPADARAPFELADQLRHDDELELCVPWLEQTLSRQPEHGWALGQLAEVLGVLGRAEALRAWLGRWRASPSAVTLHAASIAHGWLGELDEAEAAARRGVGLGAGLVAQLDLLGALVVAGRFDEAAAAFGALAEPGSPVRRLGYYTRAALHAYRGRRREGLAALDELLREVPGADRDLNCRAVRVDYLLGGGDAAAVREEVEALRRLDPRAAAEHAAAVAWLGDPAAARSLGEPLRPGSFMARTLDAVAACAEGAADEGLRRLAAVAAEAPISAWRVAPLFLLGDLAARAGRDEQALDALARLEATYTPRLMWRSWAHARALLLLARLRARTGDPAGAAAALDRLEAERGGGDPDDGVLLVARALRAGLARGRA
ncbi:MAG TPA: protein kinase [Anaeromyxobacteraceae bacterium]|nr:protein kinase [Anaeromyxobacteraceae bacterium]